MEQKRILVFPCGSEIGLELHRSLGTCKEVELWGASSVEDHGSYVYERHVSRLPFVDDANFIDRLNQVIRERRIDFIFPAHDSVVLRLARAEHAGNLACRVLTSAYETCYICRSKRRTIELMRGCVPVPRVFDEIDQVDRWPVFVKPDEGQGSRGVFTATNRAEFLQCASKSAGALIIQEYLPGEEYTIDCFTDASGALVYSGARRRVRISNGISVATLPVAMPELRTIAEQINGRLRFRGVWFFQMKHGDEGLKLLEVAARVAGSMSLQRIMGVNLPLLAVYDACGFGVTAAANQFVVQVDRAWDVRFTASIHFSHVFVDLDDCLIVNGKINADLVAFLLRCVNAGKRIHLLTRHKGVLEETLKGARLSALFDSVILVGEGGAKSQAITHADSIFIDDSFAERAEVSRALGIPVFAPDAVVGWSIHSG